MAKQIPSLEGQRKHFVGLCGKSGIKVIWNPNTPCAKAGYAKEDTKRKYPVITLKEPTAQDFTEWYADANHEISHIFPEILWTYDCIPSLLNETEKMVANVIVDVIIEWNRYGDYDGRDKSLYLGRRDHLRRDPDKRSSTEEFQAVYDACLMLRGCWQGSYPKVKITPKAERWSQGIQVSLETRVQEIMEKSSPNLLVALVKEICEMFKQPVEEQPNEQAKGASEVGESVDDKSSSPDESSEPGEDTGESGEDSEDEPGDNPEKGEGSEDNSGDDGVSGDNVDESSESDSSDGDADSDSDGRTDGDSSEDPTDGEGKAGGHGYSEFEGVPFNDICTPVETHHDWKDSDIYVARGKNVYIPIPHTNPDSYSRKVIEELVNKSVVSRNIQKHLKIVSKDRFCYGQSTGAINIKSLYKIQTTERPKIFKQRLESKLKTDTCLQLVIDCSGSMNMGYGGISRYFMASASAILMSKTLTDLRIPHEILGFTGSSRLMTYIFKDHSETVSTEKLLSRFASKDVRRINNFDGESLMICAERLSNRVSRGKLMIVLSDGEPCDGFGGSGENYLKVVCELIESSNIHLIGVGIQTDVVKRYYKNSEVVNQLSELDGVLLKLLQGALT